MTGPSRISNVLCAMDEPVLSIEAQTVMARAAQMG